eukprot:6809402-Prymnesium_polylepis.1
MGETSSAPAAPQNHTVILSSADWQSCSSQAPNLDGAWTMQGTVGNGAPYYTREARTDTMLLYYDTDCGGAGNNPAAWILDFGTLDSSRSSDVDSDGTCYFSGYLLSSELSPPVGLRTWQIYCDGVLTSLGITLAIAPPSPLSPPSPPLPPSPPSPPSLPPSPPSP